MAGGGGALSEFDGTPPLAKGKHSPMVGGQPVGHVCWEAAVWGLKQRVMVLTTHGMGDTSTNNNDTNTNTCDPPPSPYHPHTGIDGK
jgi:hypothetical protein